MARRQRDPVPLNASTILIDLRGRLVVAAQTIHPFIRHRNWRLTLCDLCECPESDPRHSAMTEERWR